MLKHMGIKGFVYEFTGLKEVGRNKRTMSGYKIGVSIVKGVN